MDYEFFVQLPAAVKQLIANTHRILQILEAAPKDTLEAHQFLTVSEAASLLNISPTRIYSLVQLQQLPYSKRGRRLYFEKEELLQWIGAGKHPTKAALEKTADNDFISLNKGRRC